MLTPVDWIVILTVNVAAVLALLFLFSFLNRKRTISVSHGSNGTVVPCGHVRAYHGDNQTFSIRGNFNYRVKDVVVDGQSVGALTTYRFKNIKEDHSLLATFEPE